MKWGAVMEMGTHKGADAFGLKGFGKASQRLSEALTVYKSGEMTLFRDKCLIPKPSLPFPH